MTALFDDARRPKGQWPAWISEVLAFGPIAELEVEWRAEIGDAITKALDLRAEAKAAGRV